MPKRRASKPRRAAKRSRTSSRAHAAAPPNVMLTMSPEQTEAYRELFWQNVVREILTELSTICAQLPQLPAASGPPTSEEEPAPEAQDNGTPAKNADASTIDPSMFDGRMAVLMKSGQRIPIAHVSPLFAAGPSQPSQRGLSLAVECTVFQVRTPDGHVFTLPLHEMRAFHAVSPEFMERLQRSRSRRRARNEPDDTPFGFAAFTSMARGMDGSPLPAEAPMNPSE